MQSILQSARPYIAALCGVLALAPVATTVAYASHSPAHGSTAAALAKRPVPAVLKSAESNAEDIVGFALESKRAKMVGQTRQLKKAMNPSTLAMLAASGVSRSTMADLKVRVDHVVAIGQTGSFIDVALAGNSVSELMPAVYARFTDPIPSQVLALDYLEREAQLRSIANDPARLHSVIADMSRTWQVLQPGVLNTTGGDKAAATYTDHVASMRQLAATSGKSLEREAIRGLELVDGLERLFTH